MLDMNVPFTVGELVRMGLYPYERPPGLTVEDAIGMVGLAEKTDTQMINLSGGERRRAYIAMTILQGAGILLLDEPLANLDIRYQTEILELLRRLNTERGITILMALHDINLAFQFDRIVLIKEGRILGVGPPGEVLLKRHIEEAFNIDVRVHKYEEVSFIDYGFNPGSSNLKSRPQGEKGGFEKHV
jgi:iron complex transport system ATP-binding protein